MRATDLIIDSFAGGGGASTGLSWALGRSPDYAINHDPEALALHEANHPETAHLISNVWQVDPLELCGKRHVGAAWFSPDCKDAQHNGERTGRGADEPLTTIVHRGTQQQVVSAHLLNLKGADRRDRSIEEPARTICGGGTHAALVAAFLSTYYGTEQDPSLGEPMATQTTKHRHSLVTVTIAGQEHVLVDIGMRMLTPRELFTAQGFPADYVIAPEYQGKPLSKTSQIRMCGNSVCPPVAAALVRANLGEEVEIRRAG